MDRHQNQSLLFEGHFGFLQVTHTHSVQIHNPNHNHFLIRLHSCPYTHITNKFVIKLTNYNIHISSPQKHALIILIISATQLQVHETTTTNQHRVFV